MVTQNFLEKIKKTSYPKDYFKGYGESLFSLPLNLLMFYRDSFSEISIQLHTDFHYRHVLILNVGMPIRIIVDSKNIYLDSNCFVLIMPYQFHRFINENQKQLSLIFITFEMTDNLFWESYRYMTGQFDKQALTMLELCYDMYNKHQIRELPFMVGSLLAHLAGKEIVNREKQYRNMKSSQLVSEICRRIYQDKSKNIKELSCELNYSESYLRKTFRKVMGVALGQYIIEVRLTDAMNYLSTTDKTISEITELVGYDNIYSLSRSFKIHIGLSPSAYRQERRKHFKSQEVYRFRNKKEQDPTQNRKQSSLHYFTKE